MTAGDADVAIVSSAVLTSVASKPDGLASALREGRSGVRQASLPASSGVRVAATLGEAAREVTGVLADPERAARLQRITRGCTLPTRTAARVGWEAVLAAGLDSCQLSRTAVVIAGNNLALDYHARTAVAFAAGTGSVLPSHALRHLDIDAIGAVSELTGATAEGCTIGGSSASGSLALIYACRLLALDAADHCLVVGALSELSPAEYRAFHDSGAMAHDPALPAVSVCRPFDRSRSGFVHGHGAAAMVLERRATALRRGRQPWAYIAGYAHRLDGKRGTEPWPERQAETIRAALGNADVGPGDVDYVNAHATGSPVGDLAEADALYRVFGSHGPLVNSTKELVGHCLSAAGVVEAVAAVLQVRGGFCHPNPNLTDPEDTRLEYVGQQAVDARLRITVSTSFAFSGVNAALVITSAEDT
jgi:malonyl-ACP decarboxylase